ncbi:MAG: hypothetical protein ACO3G4_01660 [Opitutaceae bacterium]
MNLKTIRRLAAAGLLGWTTATATTVLPALTGSLTFSGNQAVYLQGTADPLTIYNTTGLDFNDGDPNDTPVVSSNATVATATGSFVPILGAAAQVRDFTFATPPGAAYAVWTAGDFNFYLTSVTIDVNAPWLRIFGDGYVEATGYTRTLGYFNLDVLASRTLTQVRGVNFAWTATSGVYETTPVTLNNVVAVEEGVPVMELLGLAGSALIGGWFVVNRRRRRREPLVLRLAQSVG